MSDNSEYSRPVQCSDDVPGQPPSYQTGQEMLGSQNLQTDAERAGQHTLAQGSHQATSGAGGGDVADHPQDVITITSPNSTIVATGLAGALKPGTVFQLGSENHMTVYHGSRHGDSDSRPANIRNQYRITDSQAEPTIKHLDVISAGLAGDWRRLGRKLGLEDALLEQIRIDHHIEGQHEVNYRILMKWKQQCAHATVHLLARALVQIDRGDLADELRNG